jgi:hypothetical protein
MSLQFTFQSVLVSEVCFKCGIQFAMPEDFKRALLRDKSNFYCPNGHEQHYLGETAEQKRIKALEAELKGEKESREWAENQTRAARIARTKAENARKRLETRVACGVCPHCQRTVKQLAAHIRTKHPEQVPPPAGVQA